MSTSQVPTFTKRISQLARQVKYSLIALALVNVCFLRAVAQDVHSHSTTTPNELTADQQSKQSTLLRVVREATERFKDVRHAEHEGYRLEFGCVSGDDFGAMGLHYVNDTLVGDGIVDVTRPQIVLYEAQPDGSLKLTGADYLVIASAWDEKHPGTPPQLMGQIFHYFESPNRFGLPAFYTLHVWAWKENPKGAFVNWHPNVSCQSFVGQTTP
ncbi:MAG TPA: hypothetical protein VN833_12145 [Candidatus Acidoferrales bacterium]|jgi:hypothetical protein|nr:hypothetical protein [Candidatus Acidoferrales bacterium]